MIMWDPATYPDVQDHRRPRQDRAKVLLLQWRGLHGLPHPHRRAEEGPGRRLATTATRPTSSPTRARCPAGLRLGRAVPLRERDPGLGQAGRVQLINDTGCRTTPVDRDEPENSQTLRRCFKKLVPIIQQASVDYLKTPAKTNAIILEAVQKFNNGWVYSQGVADYAVKTMLDRPGRQRPRRARSATSSRTGSRRSSTSSGRSLHQGRASR